jgi:hypothetical protein
MEAKKMMDTIARAFVTALTDRPLLPTFYQDIEAAAPPSPLKEIIILDSPISRPFFSSNHGACAPQSPSFR